MIYIIPIVAGAVAYIVWALIPRCKNNPKATRFFAIAFTIYLALVAGWFVRSVGSTAFSSTSNFFRAIGYGILAGFGIAIMAAWWVLLFLMLYRGLAWSYRWLRDRDHRFNAARYAGMVLGLGVMILFVWILISGIHWLWNHSLF